jgi:hypothetical protein
MQPEEGKIRWQTPVTTVRAARQPGRSEARRPSCAPASGSQPNGPPAIGAFDVPPYVNSADQSGAVPFLDIANRYILAGAQYNPQVLAGLSAAQIASQLSNPASPVARAIDGSAQVIVAAIDQVLHDKTASQQAPGVSGG